MNPKYSLLFALVVGLLFAPGCKKESKSSDQGGGGTSNTSPATSQSTTLASTMEGPAPEPVRHWVDERLTPGVWLTVNGCTEPELPQGWPLIITATVMGAQGPAAEFSVDDVSVRVTDAAGKDAAWPMKRVSKTKTLKVDETTGDSVTWVNADTAALVPETYLISASLKGGSAHSISITVVAAPAKPTPQQETSRFALGIQAALWMDDPESALRQAETRSAANPRDWLSLEYKGDALTAMGKKTEGHAAYAKALSLFIFENPKAEPPNHLLEKLQVLQNAADTQPG